MRILDRRAPISSVPVLLALSLMAGGCATLLHGSRQKIEVFTDPPGATATAGDQQVTTPGVLNLQRKAKDIQIRIEKDGFSPKIVVLQRRTSGLVWLNSVTIPAGFLGGYATANRNRFLGGLNESATGGAAGTAIGLLTDYGKGGAYRLEPARVVVRLEPVSTSVTKN